MLLQTLRKRDKLSVACGKLLLLCIILKWEENKIRLFLLLLSLQVIVKDDRKLYKVFLTPLLFEKVQELREGYWLEQIHKGGGGRVIFKETETDF